MAALLAALPFEAEYDAYFAAVSGHGADVLGYSEFVVAMLEADTPWCCTGCHTWNWACRSSCRACGPQDSTDGERTLYMNNQEDTAPQENICMEQIRAVECYSIDEADITDYEVDFFPTFGPEGLHAEPDLGGKVNEAVVTVSAYLNDSDDDDNHYEENLVPDDRTLGAQSGQSGDGKKVARSAMKDPEVDRKLVNASYGTEHPAYQMIYIHGRYDGTSDAEGDSCVSDGKKIALGAMRDPGVKLKLVNASYDMEYPAYRMKSDSIHERYDGTIAAEGDSLVGDGKTKDPEVDRKLVNASYDTERPAYQLMGSGKDRGKVHGVQGAHGDHADDDMSVPNSDGDEYDYEYLNQVHVKGPEVELKLVNASYDKEHSAYRMKSDSIHGRHDGAMVAKLEQDKDSALFSMGHITPEITGWDPADLSAVGIADSLYMQGQQHGQGCAEWPKLP